MNSRVFALLVLLLGPLAATAEAAPRAGESPADRLPPYITQVAWFGERADWSLDGRKVLFLSKTFGDALELDRSASNARPLAIYWCHFSSWNSGVRRRCT